MLGRRINIWDWEGVFLFSTGGYDEGEVCRQLIYCDAPDSIIKHVSRNIKAGRKNEGFTFSSPILRRSVVYVGHTSSGAEFLSTFCHELAHFTRDVCLADNVSLRGEKMAYFEGEVALRLSDIVCELSCDNCRGL